MHQQVCRSVASCSGGRMGVPQLHRAVCKSVLAPHLVMGAASSAPELTPGRRAGALRFRCPGSALALHLVRALPEPEVGLRGGEVWSANRREAQGSVPAGFSPQAAPWVRPLVRARPARGTLDASEAVGQRSPEEWAAAFAVPRQGALAASGPRAVAEAVPDELVLAVLTSGAAVQRPAVGHVEVPEALVGRQAVREVCLWAAVSIFRRARLRLEPARRPRVCLAHAMPCLRIASRRELSWQAARCEVES